MDKSYEDSVQQLLDDYRQERMSLKAERDEARALVKRWRAAPWDTSWEGQLQRDTDAAIARWDREGT